LARRGLNTKSVPLSNHLQRRGVYFLTVSNGTLNQSVKFMVI